MKIRTTALVLVTAGSACTPAVQSSTVSRSEAPEVRNIILMVADGAGANLWSTAELVNDDLSVKRMPVLGLLDTRSARHKVTDSAAGAGAFATGERITNRTISVAASCPFPSLNTPPTTPWPDGCDPLESWFRIARDGGKATGLVTTTDVVDATPASFVAHSPSRYWGDTIAAQTAEFGLDVLLGGGRRHFAGAERADGRDLYGAMCARSQCVTNAQELGAYRPDDRPLVGLFSEGDMDAHPQRPVGVPAMVSAALERLARAPDGFVAMFESEATDNATHGNEPLERLTADMLEFDAAVGVALDFAERHPGTLVVVTGDHETGGVSLVESDTTVVLHYTTGGHTAGLVPLFAYGPQAERFGGYRENYEIGRLFLEIVRGW